MPPSQEIDPTASAVGPSATDPLTRWIERLPTVPKPVVWGLVILSVLSIFLSPLESTIDRAIEVAPWVALALVITEVMFVAGLAIMASLVGVGIGWNPFQWHHRFDETVANVSVSPAFWTGFVVNTIGGVGTGVVLAVGIVLGLPPQSWGLLVLPFLDLVLTAAVRGAVLSRVRRPGKENRTW